MNGENVCKNSMEYYSAIKTRKFAICGFMGGPYGHMLSEISQTEKDKCHMISLISGI